MRLKSICDFVSRGSTPDYVDESPYKVMNQATFSKGFLDESKIRFTRNENKDAHIKKGDLLMASTGGGVLGKVYYFDSDDKSFYADSHVSILRNSKGRHLMKYLYYYFSIKYDEINETMVKGSTNQTELQRNYLIAHEIDMPPIETQKKIVSYLDAKIASIDKRIEILEKQSKAYTRLKKSIVHHAVTQGLNSSVTLKNSGVAWIGMIPSNWDIKRIKDVSEINKKTLPENTDSNYKFQYIDISNVDENGKINNGDIMLFSEAPSRARRIVQKNDIIVSTVRTYLRAIAQIDFNANDTIVSTGFAVLSPLGVNSKFLLYSIRDNIIVDAICSQSSGVSYPAISASRLSAISIPCPPIDEQQAIANYLDEKCARIDASIENIKKQIDLSTRLKNAVIYEALKG